jgi:hypothetical protein
MILNQLRTFFMTAVAYQRQSHFRHASKQRQTARTTAEEGGFSRP